jgi:hypothetical protein
MCTEILVIELWHQTDSREPVPVGNGVESNTLATELSTGVQHPRSKCGVISGHQDPLYLQRILAMLPTVLPVAMLTYLEHVHPLSAPVSILGFTF